MILKGNQRAGGADLATHLLNAYDNERVEVAEIRGTVATDLLGAFAEFEAIASGTRCKQPLYSLSINPSAPITRAQYDAAIVLTEERLGLAGQARAVVFHTKHGREHCHVVWCRIDAVRLRAIPMSHDHNKLRALARELALAYGLALPPGLRIDRGPARFEEPPDMTLAEKAQAEESGIIPEQRRAEVTEAWRGSDTAPFFRMALLARGYTLARGDRRGFVVIDSCGHIHSLARCIEGAKTKDIRAKLSPLAPEDLPPAKEAQAAIRQRAKAALDAELAADIAAQWQKAREALKARHTQRRIPLLADKQDCLVRHAAERMTLHAAQLSETTALAQRRAATDAKPLSALLAHVPGYAVMVRYLRRRQNREQKRLHDEQCRALRLRHDCELLDYARKFRALGKIEARERHALEKHFARVERQQRRAAKSAARRAAFAENARDITTPVKAATTQVQAATGRNRGRAGRGGRTLRPAGFAQGL